MIILYNTAVKSQKAVTAYFSHHYTDIKSALQKLPFISEVHKKKVIK